MPALTLQIHPSDDAIVALQDLPQGHTAQVAGDLIELSDRIPAKHKFAAKDFAKGDLVTQFGVTVGRALEPIVKGGLLTTSNIIHESAEWSGHRGTHEWTPPDTSRWQGATFQGFRRKLGPAGTANHWLVIPLVFCENRNLAVLRETLTRALGYHHTTEYQRFADRLVDMLKHGDSREEIQAFMPDGGGAKPPVPVFPNLSGIKFLEHGLGCGGTRDDARALCRLLAGYICHPNVAGVTILSLGCQHAQVALLEEELQRIRPSLDKPLLVFEQQKSFSEREMISQAMKATLLGIADAGEQTREPCPVSDLVMGVECGGSDGFSGISANPAIGHASDVLAALGGSPVLSEFPELCGVEQSLCDRCVSDELASRFTELMRAYSSAAEACGSGFDANPSPGNIRDGLTTDAIKSAGAAKKGGQSPVVDVLDYADVVSQRGGLTLCCTPGNDVESTTAMAGAGCNVMLFSTGLGTPTGNPVCPVLKISSNSELATRMSDLIDFDAGPIIRGELTVEQAGEALFDLVLATASGDYTPRAVALGQDDFLPWKRGVSL
jgi:altronate hydrolase